MPLRNDILFLDWYKTLSFETFWRTIQSSDPQGFARIESNLFHDGEHLNRWMTGLHSSETICSLASRHSGIPAERLFSELQADCLRMSIDQRIVDAINGLRSHFHVFLVTDNMDCFSRFTVPSMRIEEWTDGIRNSSDIGRLKNDLNGKTFQDAARDLGVPMRQTICIDDNEQTCRLLASLGGTAFQTKSEKETLEILSALHSRCFFTNNS